MALVTPRNCLFLGDSGIPLGWVVSMSVRTLRAVPGEGSLSSGARCTLGRLRFFDASIDSFIC